MHHHECGPAYHGLCDKMKPIDGEVLLKFLRQVNFTGQTDLILLKFLRQVNFTGHTDFLEHLICLHFNLLL